MSSNPINLTVTLASPAESTESTEIEIRIPTTLYAGLGCVDTVTGEEITFTKLYFANNIKHFKRFEGEQGKNLFATNPNPKVTREVYFDGTAEDWLKITFEYPDCNPLFDGGNLYFKNPKTNKYDLVTQFVLADASHSTKHPLPTIQVPDYSLYGCLSLKKLVLVNEVGLESIGEQAFYNCKNLREVYLDRPAAGKTISFGNRAFALEDWVDFAMRSSNQDNQDDTENPEDPDSIEGLEANEDQEATEEKPTWEGALPIDRQEGIEAVYFNGTMRDWCSSQFGTVTEEASVSTRNSTTANPLYSGSYLYLKSGLGYDRQTDLVVPQLPGNAPIARASLIGLRIKSIDLSAVNICGAAGLLTNCNVQKLILPYLESNTDTPTHLGYFFTDIELQNNLKDDAKNLSNAFIDLIPHTLQEVTIKGGRVGGITLDTNPTSQIAQAIQGLVGCKDLKKICFDSDVVAIAKGATCGCKSLESLTVNSLRQETQYQLGDIFGTPDQLNTLLGISGDEGATEGDTAYIAKYFGESIVQGYPKTLTFRDGGDDAYNPGCTTFLPKTLKTCTVLQDHVSPGAFAGCAQLENILLENVTVIGAWAFFNCTGITSIKIPDSTRRIGSSVFAGCDNLKALDLPFCGGRLFESTFEITPNRDYYALLPSPESLNSKDPEYVNSDTAEEAIKSECGDMSVGEWAQAQNLFNHLELADLSPENAPEIKLYYSDDLFGVSLESTGYYYLSLDHILPYLFEHIYDDSEKENLNVKDIEKPAVLESNYYCTFARVCKPFSYAKSVLQEYGEGAGWNYFETDLETSKSYAEEQKFSGRMLAYIPTNLSSLAIRHGALQREAFAGFTSVKTLTLGAGVEDIALIAEGELEQETWAMQISVLDEIHFAYGHKLPDLPTRLLGFPWQDCHELNTIQVDAKNKKYFASGLYLCERTAAGKSKLLLAAEAGVTQNSGILDVSDSVDTITPAAFYKHETLAHFVGNKLEGIPKACFFYCQSLESIEALNLNYCYRFAFNGCTKLKKIRLRENPAVVYQPHTEAEIDSDYYIPALPSKTQFIGSFQNSTQLTEVDAPMWALLYCDLQNIETLRISCGPTIEMQDFVTLRLNEQLSYVDSDTYTLSYITPPEFLKLKKLIIGSEVQYIADRAFYIAKMPTTFDGKPVKSLGHQLPALEQIIIEDRSPNCNHYNSGLVGHVAFSSCPTIKEINIGEGIETLGASSFALATQLEKVHFPTTLTVVGNRAFSGCVNLLEITCPKGLLGIGAAAFQNCARLRTVNFNRRLKFIGEYAFANTDLRSLELILDEPTNFTWSDLDYQIVKPNWVTSGKGGYDIAPGGQILCHISEKDPTALNDLPWDPNSVAAVTLQSKYTYLSSWTNYADKSSPHESYACFRNTLTHDVPTLEGIIGTASSGTLGDGICITPSLKSLNSSRIVESPEDIEIISWRQSALADYAAADEWEYYAYIAQIPETGGPSSLEFNKSDDFLFTEDSITAVDLDLSVRCTLLLRTQIQSDAFANTPLKHATIQVGPKNQPALIHDRAFYACNTLRELYLDCEGIGFVRPIPKSSGEEDSLTRLQVTWADAAFDQATTDFKRKACGLLNAGLENGTMKLGSSVKALGVLAFRSTGLVSVDIASAIALSRLPAGCFQACLYLETARLSSNIKALEAKFGQIAPMGAEYLEFLGNPFSGCANLQAVYGLEPTDKWMSQFVPQTDSPTEKDYRAPEKWAIFEGSNPHLRIAEELRDSYEHHYYQQQ